MKTQTQFFITPHKVTTKKSFNFSWKQVPTPRWLIRLTKLLLTLRLLRSLGGSANFDGAESRGLTPRSSRRAAVRWPGAEAPRVSRLARRHGGCTSPIRQLAAAAVPLCRWLVVAARG